MIDFLVVGSEHSGEAWLAARLVDHPDIQFLPQLPAYERSLDSDSLAGVLLDRHGLKGKAPDARLTGDRDPGYSMLTPDQIETLWRRQPELRVFMVLRSPVERAWLALANALRIAQMAPAEASDQWIRDFLGSSFQRAQNDLGAMLEVWSRTVPKGRLQVILYDAMTSDPATVLDRAVEFLGLQPSGMPPTTAGPDHAADLAAISPGLATGFRRPVDGGPGSPRRPCRDISWQGPA